MLLLAVEAIKAVTAQDTNTLINGAQLLAFIISLVVLLLKGIPSIRRWHRDAIEAQKKSIDDLCKEHKETVKEIELSHKRTVHQAMAENREALKSFADLITVERELDRKERERLAADGIKERHDLRNVIAQIVIQAQVDAKEAREVFREESRKDREECDAHFNQMTAHLNKQGEILANALRTGIMPIVGQPKIDVKVHHEHDR